MNHQRDMNAWRQKLKIYDLYGELDISDVAIYK